MVYLLIPTYNEEKNIPNLISQLKNTLSEEKKFYVFSDDGSSDSTRELIKEAFGKNQCVVLAGGANNGPGYAFNAGFEWILDHSKSKEDRVVTLEADCTSDLKILPVMLTLSRMGYELVLASVYAQGGGFEKTTFLRKLLSLLANMILRSIYGIKLLTLSSFYRVYDITLLIKIKENHHVIVKEPGFISMMEILVKSIMLKSSIIEVPMKLDSTKRQGKSKMKIMKTLFSYLKFLITFRRL